MCNAYSYIKTRGFKTNIVSENIVNEDDYPVIRSLYKFRMKRHSFGVSNHNGYAFCFRSSVPLTVAIVTSLFASSEGW